MNDTLKIHPFERSLGPGPYRVVGMFTLVLPSEANQGRNNFHMAPYTESGVGSCAHCGMGIIYNYIVSNSEGKRFAIGSQCVEKVGLPAKEVSKVQRIERERIKKQRQERKAKKGQAAREELKTLLVNDSAILKALPHPNEFRAKNGATLFDYAQWIVEHSNDGGIVIALTTIKTQLNKPL